MFVPVFFRPFLWVFGFAPKERPAVEIVPGRCKLNRDIAWGAWRHLDRSVSSLSVSPSSEHPTGAPKVS